MSKLKTPTGLDIIGTLEVVQAYAGITSVERNSDGSLAVEHDGNTEIWWDTQRTQRDPHSQQRLFADTDGGLWEESKLILEDDE